MVYAIVYSYFRSVLYSFDISQMKLHPADLPIKLKVRQVAASQSHVIVVTTERAVFTWGSNNKGQLGHDDLQTRTKPTVVETLKGKSIAR